MDNQTDDWKGRKRWAHCGLTNHSLNAQSDHTLCFSGQENKFRVERVFGGKRVTTGFPLSCNTAGTSTKRFWPLNFLILGPKLFQVEIVCLVSELFCFRVCWWSRCWRTDSKRHNSSVWDKSGYDSFVISICQRKSDAFSSAGLSLHPSVLSVCLYVFNPPSVFMNEQNFLGLHPIMCFCRCWELQSVRRVLTSSITAPLHHQGQGTLSVTYSERVYIYIMIHML